MTEETHTQAQKREAERIAELRAVLDGDECVHLTADGTLYFCGRQKSVDEKRNVELLAEIERLKAELTTQHDVYLLEMRDASDAKMRADAKLAAIVGPLREYREDIHEAFCGLIRGLVDPAPDHPLCKAVTEVVECIAKGEE